MTCKYRRTQAEIEADITKYKLKLSEAEETYSALLTVANVNNRFNDNEGDQQTTKRKLSEQQNAIDWIEDKLAKLQAELCGKSSRVTHTNRRSISGGGHFI